MPSEKKITWLLVEDASRAKIFESAGVRKIVHELDDMQLVVDLPKSRELLADRPGRTFDSVGGGRHAKENPTDPHRQLKRDFAKKVVAELRRAMLAHKFDRLFLVAPPAFLGDLRDELPKDLKDKVVGEIALGLTNMPQQQLHGRLQEILTGKRSA
jgi:protein required for attachment to host cells